MRKKEYLVYVLKFVPQNLSGSKGIELRCDFSEATTSDPGPLLKIKVSEFKKLLSLPVSEVSKFLSELEGVLSQDAVAEGPNDG